MRRRVQDDTRWNPQAICQKRFPTFVDPFLLFSFPSLLSYVSSPLSFATNNELLQFLLWAMSLV